MKSMGGWAALLWATLHGAAAYAECSVADRVSLARSGYQKAEIEAMCAGTAPAPVRPPPPPVAAGDAAPAMQVACVGCPEMVNLPGGRFEMGGAESNEEKPVHAVAVAPFSLSRTEVTQAQWAAVMGGNPSRFPGCDDCAVDNVSWEDVQIFLQQLKVKTGMVYRLPSEAEWEYACRAGGSHRYCGGDKLDEVAWTAEGNSSPRTNPVGRKAPNAFGLHDMSGNVWEWVQDCWNDNYQGAPASAVARTGGDCRVRVLRGGSWLSDGANSRSAKRFFLESRTRGTNIGFRVAGAPF